MNNFKTFGFGIAIAAMLLFLGACSGSSGSSGSSGNTSSNDPGYSLSDDPTMQSTLEQIDPDTKVILDHQLQQNRKFRRDYEKATELDKRSSSLGKPIDSNTGQAMWEKAMQQQRELDYRKNDFQRQQMINQTQTEAQSYIDSDPTN